MNYLLPSTNHKPSRANATNIGDPALTHTVKELTVKATTHSTDNLSPEQKSGDPTNSQQIQEKIDNLIKLQEQYLILELARIDRMIRERNTRIG